MLFLRDQGAKVNTYIPKRKGEGYGLNSEALKTISEGKTTLLITVDCGISGFNEVATAPQGMDIIITDHHMPPAKMPPAFAIINPKQEGCQYPFKELSGVGVAFKLCQAIYQMEHLTEPLWEKYTELAALGTVADIVSLRGENRELVKRGLKALETTKLIGLRKLMELSMCPTKDITSDNIGFIIAPRLNAVGRLEHAQLAVELLTTDDPAKAQSIAENLNKENALRQDISRKIFEEACAMLAEQKQIKTAIVLAKEGWHAGVIGIVASRLVDKYNLPTILISIDGKNAKGSCRSIPALDLYDAIRECADDLIQFGGHKQAAGLTLRTARIDAFRQHFTNVVAGKLDPKDYEPKLNVDVLLDGSQKLALPILKQLKLLEPFGCDNPLPVFAMRDVQLRSPKIFGKEQKHLRFFVNYLNETYHSIMWNGSDYKSCLYNNATADIAFVPKINVFQGLESINLQVMAFNQGLVIYDYRQGNVDKLTLLKALLQTRSGVTVFTNEETQVPEEWQNYANLHISHYGTTAPDTENVFVLFDFPKAKIYTEEHFPVPHALGKTMIILYNVSEFQHLRKEVFAKVPDRRHLIFVYKYVMGMLKTNQVMRIADLKTGAAEQGLVLNGPGFADF
jgi:single-stranded-DNA-specific exonuclease